MCINTFLRSWSNQRPRLFEFLIVSCVVALTVAEARIFYRAISNDAIDVVAQSYAGSFERTVSSIHALASPEKTRFVKVGSTPFFLNEYGWPANTEKNLSASIYNQSDLECRQLWEGVFSNKENNEFSDLRYKRNVEFTVSLNKKRICRYSLMLKQEGSIFIDYDVITGSVRVVHPD